MASTRTSAARCAAGIAALNAIARDPSRARAWSDQFELFGCRNLRLRSMKETRLGIW